jgi:hypothetical protein
VRKNFVEKSRASMLMKLTQGGKDIVTKKIKKKKKILKALVIRGFLSVN